MINYPQCINTPLSDTLCGCSCVDACPLGKAGSSIRCMQKELLLAKYQSKQSVFREADLYLTPDALRDILNNMIECDKVQPDIIIGA